jgi:hypothetical protein
MTVYDHNPAALGLSNGTALTNGSSTSGAGGWVVTASTSTGGTITMQSNEWELIGNPGVARLDGSITAADAAGLDLIFDVVATPTVGANRIMEFRYASNFQCRVDHMTDGKFRIYDAANASLYTTTIAAVTGDRVRVFAAMQKGATGTNDGKVRLQITKTSPLTNATPDETYSNDAKSMGTNQTTILRGGRVSSIASSTADIKIIRMRATDTLTPPPTLGVPPTVSYTQNVLREIDFTASTDDTSASLTSQTSGPDITASFDASDYPKVRFKDVPGRTTDIVLNIQVSGLGGTTSTTVTVTPTGDVAAIEYEYYDGTTWLE